MPTSSSKLHRTPPDAEHHPHHQAVTALAERAIRVTHADRAGAYRREDIAAGREENHTDCPRPHLVYVRLGKDLGSASHEAYPERT